MAEKPASMAGTNSPPDVMMCEPTLLAHFVDGVRSDV